MNISELTAWQVCSLLIQLCEGINRKDEKKKKSSHLERDKGGEIREERKEKKPGETTDSYVQLKGVIDGWLPECERPAGIKKEDESTEHGMKGGKGEQEKL